MNIDLTTEEWDWLIKMTTRWVAFSEMHDDAYQQWKLPDRTMARQLLDKFIKERP